MNAKLYGSIMYLICFILNLYMAIFDWIKDFDIFTIIFIISSIFCLISSISTFIDYKILKYKNYGL